MSYYIFVLLICEMLLLALAACQDVCYHKWVPKIASDM